MEPIHILLVDDDQDMLTYIKAVLARDGYRVALATNGEEALELLAGFRPELIIADVKMPGMSGYELCRRVRAEGMDDIPFLFCSSLASLPERVEGLRMGADDYLVKPVDAEELLLRVATQLRSSRRLQAYKNQVAELSSPSVITGQLSEMGGGELLQLLSLQRIDEVWVHLERSDGGDGDLFIENLRIVHAEAGPVTGKKALYRMIGWREGAYRVQHGFYPDQPSMSLPINEAILEGASHLDECRHLKDALSTKGIHCAIHYTPELFRRQFENPVRDLIALTEELHQLDQILDASPLSDLETLRIFQELVQTGIVEIGPSPHGEEAR